MYANTTYSRVHISIYILQLQYIHLHSVGGEDIEGSAEREEALPGGARVGCRLCGAAYPVPGKV